MKMRAITALVLLVSGVYTGFAGPDADRIAAKCKVLSRDRMQGFDRMQFEFEGCMAWVVESAKPADISSSGATTCADTIRTVLSRAKGLCS